MKALIVGVDPGTYVGVAIFDVNMQFISASTITNAGKEGVVSEISKHGSPIVIATDVAKPPEFVIQIASYYNARLVHPKIDMREREKTEMTSQFKPNSNHERDAMAAVIHFFNENTNKMRWIETMLREKGLTRIEEDVKRFALSGMRVDDAIKALTPSDKEYEAVMAFAASLPETQKNLPKNDRRKEDRDTLLGLLESNIRMRSRLTLLEEENGSLRHRIEELKESGIDKQSRLIIKQKDMQIRRLQALLEKVSSDAKRKRAQQIVETQNIQHKQSAETPTKDLKEEEEDLGLSSIIEEYRESRVRGGKRF